MLGRHGTVIVGAGISGLACARTLFDAGHDFALVSADVGGRVLRSNDGAAPLGAFYVRADYEHLGPFVDRGRRIRSWDTLRHDASGSYGRGDRRLLGHPIQVARFVALLWRFRRHYRRFKVNSLVVSQAQALTSDGFLNGLYHQSAPATVHEYGFEDIAEAYVAPSIHGTVFVALERLSGFAMLLGALPAIEPTYEFSMRWHDLTEGFADNVSESTVDQIVTADGGWRVQAEDGRAWFGERAVVATAPSEAQRLLGLERVKESVTAHVFELEGTLRAEWTNSRLHLFSDDHPTLALLQRQGCPVLLCSRDSDPQFERYFSEWAVLEHHHWDPAFNIIGDTLIECEQAPNLFVVGDHNVCGLEDAFITGVHAARRIIAAGT